MPGSAEHDIFICSPFSRPCQWLRLSAPGVHSRSRRAASFYGFHTDAPSFFGRWTLLMGFVVAVGRRGLQAGTR